MVTTIGTRNPFRYRGYCYDEETGFYYVSSRYYDPEVGRFINSDSILPGLSVSLLGYNAYSYCVNNPVKLIDQDGNVPRNNLSRSAFSGHRMKSASWHILNGNVNFTKTLRQRADLKTNTQPISLRKYKESRLDKTPIVSFEIGVGLGFGFGAQANYGGIDIGIEAKAAHTESAVVSENGLDYTTCTGIGTGLSIGSIDVLGINLGKSHSFHDPDCTCDWWEDPLGNRWTCPASEWIGETDWIIGYSASIYYIFGAEMAFGINLTQLCNTLIGSS